MTLRLLAPSLAILLFSAASSEARRGSGGGGLAQARGLSQTESQAAGEVLAATARDASDSATTATTSTARYSPDYYRVYHPQPRTAVKKTTVAAQPASTPAPVARLAPTPRRAFVPTPAAASTPKPKSANPFSRRPTPASATALPQDASGTIYLPRNGRVPSAAPAPTPGAKPRRALFR